ncbi:MAG: MFS transporter, partial [Propionicimonas sp.]|nr:MFS transporter [Propionicimonas sp.]
MTLPASTRALITNRPFVTLLGARTLSMLGVSFAPVALAFGILQLPGADAGTLSLVLVAQTAPLVVFMLVGGVVADRYPRAAVMLTGQVLSAAGWAAIGVMLLTGYAPVWLLCLAAAVAGVAGAAMYPALNGIIPDLVPLPDRQQANAWLGMGASSARLVGLVSGGAVVVLLGGGWAMVVAGALYVGAALLTLTLRRIVVSLADGRVSPLRQLAEGWKEFSSRQ